MIIGIAGTLGAGKGTVVEYLKSKGFVHYSASGVLKEIIEARGEKPDREKYSILGDELREKNPAGPIAVLYDKAISHGEKKVIIESIHDIAEADFLKNKNIFLIGVDADMDVRYERIKIRGSEKDNVSFEEFKKIAIHEEEGGGKHNIREVLKKVDVVIENNGTIETLHEKLEKILGNVVN